MHKIYRTSEMVLAIVNENITLIPFAKRQMFI